MTRLDKVVSDRIVWRWKVALYEEHDKLPVIKGNHRRVRYGFAKEELESSRRYDSVCSRGRHYSVMQPTQTLPSFALVITTLFLE